VHKKPIPLLGGLAIYISFIITLILKQGMIEGRELGIIIGATIIVIGGIIDDIKELKPGIKLIFQIVAAIVLIVSGVKINILTNPFAGTDGMVNISWFAYPFTIFWVVGITNALNLIDGLDGLAAGVALISTITIFVNSVIYGRYEASILTAILGGAILGFLPFNFNPASIFMGDTGAQLLGFLLAAISMVGTIKSAAAFQDYFHYITCNQLDLRNRVLEVLYCHSNEACVRLFPPFLRLPLSCGTILSPLN
jgi:UDP-GlcNAc:undecaprenyl-phosphate GlcNAc-1-phosphate transferase